MIHDWTFPNGGNKAIKQLDETTLLTAQGVTDGAGFVWGVEYLGQVVRNGYTAEGGRNLMEAENASTEYRNHNGAGHIRRAGRHRLCCARLSV